MLTDRQETPCPVTRTPKFVTLRRTVLVGNKEVCRASSLEWAKRISRALNEQEGKSR